MNELQMTSSYSLEIVWRNVISYLVVHIAALYGFYLTFTSAKWQTNLFALFLYMISALGVTAGAHRLWCHRTYKAKLALRIFLAFLFTIAFQNDIFDWARDHRVHHKFSETDDDPINSKRGFFFSHIGWLLCKKHPSVIKEGKTVPVDDLLADPVVKFHRKYYVILVTVCCFILPTVIPVILWEDSFCNAFFIAAILRLCLLLHATWLVNSAAHRWGNRPYDTTIYPRENMLISFFALGEGFHNYHHSFPYDYAVSEFGIKNNLTTLFINIMAWFGLAYDRRSASKSSIRNKKLRTGNKNKCNSNQKSCTKKGYWNK